MVVLHLLRSRRSWKSLVSFSIGAALPLVVQGIVWQAVYGTPLSVVAFTVADGRIRGITAVIDPAKLASMNLPYPHPRAADRLQAAAESEAYAE